MDPALKESLSSGGGGRGGAVAGLGLWAAGGRASDQQGLPQQVRELALELDLEKQLQL